MYHSPLEYAIGEALKLHNDNITPVSLRNPEEYR